MKQKEGEYFAGKLLVSMPFVHPSPMSQLVIYLCGHDNQGAIGLVLNRIFPTMSFPELLEQLGVSSSAKKCRPLVLHYGGSVEISRGFVLHSPDVQTSSTVIISSQLALTSTIDILRLLAEGKGPEKALVSLGYTAWPPGKLDEEIQKNLWMIIDNPTANLIFHPHVDHSWHQSMAHIGVKPQMLSLEMGHA